MTYVYAPNEGDDTLYVRQLDGTKIYTIPVGSAPRVLRRLAVRRLLREPAERRPAAAVDAAAAVAAVAAGAATGATPHRAASSCSTSRPATSTACPTRATSSSLKARSSSPCARTRRTPRPSTTAPTSSCASWRRGITQNIGNVNLYDFDDAGRMLAYTVDAADRVGNGVYVIDLATSQSKVLSSARRRLRPAHVGRQGRVARRAARRQEERERAARQHAARLAGRRVGASRRAVEYDPSKDASVPEGLWC